MYIQILHKWISITFSEDTLSIFLIESFSNAYYIIKWKSKIKIFSSFIKKSIKRFAFKLWLHKASYHSYISNNIFFFIKQQRLKSLQTLQIGIILFRAKTLLINVLRLQTTLQIDIAYFPGKTMFIDAFIIFNLL